MKRIALVLVAAFFPATLNAVGTKKKKQKIHVRREFVAFNQTEALVEFHSPRDTFHSLRCKGTGMEKCRWQRPPQMDDKEFTLEFIDEMVAKTVVVVKRGQTSLKDTGVHELNRHIRILYWALPNGYEYIIEEGELADLSETDSLTQRIDVWERKYGEAPRGR